MDKYLSREYRNLVYALIILVFTLFSRDKINYFVEVIKSFSLVDLLITLSLVLLGISVLKDKTSKRKIKNIFQKKLGWFEVSASTIISTFAVFIFYYWLNLNSWEERGVFGDSFGALNFIISTLAFTGIIYTIQMQRIELNIAKSEVDRNKHETELENFERIFFELVKRHQELVNNIKLDKLLFDERFDDRNVGYFSGEDALYKYFILKHEEFESIKKMYPRKSIEAIMREVFFSNIRVEIFRGLQVIKSTIEYIENHEEVKRRNKAEFYRRIFNTFINEYQAFWEAVSLVSVAREKELKIIKSLNIHDEFRIIKINPEIIEYLYNKIENA